MKIFFAFLFTILLGSAVIPYSALANEPLPPDSIGITEIKGKKFIQHKVDPGETLYRLSKRYRIPVETLISVNYLSSEKIATGEVLLVPLNPREHSQVFQDIKAREEQVKELLASKAKKDPEQQQGPPPGGGSPRFHTIEKGQTLYFLSKKYGVTVEEIQKLNGLTSSGLQIGQRLKIPAQKVAEPSFPPKDPTPEKEKVEKEPALPIPAVEEKRVEKIDQEGVRETEVSGSQVAKKRESIHFVFADETFFSISEKYNMTIRELKELNAGIDTDIVVGQKLNVYLPTPIEVKKGVIAFDFKEEAKNTTSKSESLPESHELPDPLAAPGSEESKNAKISGFVVIPPDAKTVIAYKKGTAEPYYKVTEEGKAGSLSGGNMLQQKFYGAHKFLLPGKLLKVENPLHKQSITVEIIEKLAAEDTAIIRLSEKSRKYLLISGEDNSVILRYTLPKTD